MLGAGFVRIGGWFFPNIKQRPPSHDHASHCECGKHTYLNVASQRKRLTEWPGKCSFIRDSTRNESGFSWLTNMSPEGLALILICSFVKLKRSLVYAIVDPGSCGRRLRALSAIYLFKAGKQAGFKGRRRSLGRARSC